MSFKQTLTELNGETKSETLFSNPEEDKPVSLSITTKGQIVSQLSTGETEQEAQTNTTEENPEIPMTGENKLESPLSMRQYNAHTPPNIEENLYEPELLNIEEDKLVVPSTREDKVELTNIEEDKAESPNTKE